MCMTFCCNPQINFCLLFRSSDFVIFGLKAFRHWVYCERNSSYSFSQIFLNICSFCQGLKMCMTFAVILRFFLLPFRSSDFCEDLKICMMFGCNPPIHFLSFFTSVNLVILGLNAYIHWVLCERNSYNFTWIILKLCWCFCQCLKMCMTFGCNPQMKFCHIFRSLNFNSFYQSL